MHQARWRGVSHLDRLEVEAVRDETCGSFVFGVDTEGGGRTKTMFDVAAAAQVLSSAVGKSDGYSCLLDSCKRYIL